MLQDSQHVPCGACRGDSPIAMRAIVRGEADWLRVRRWVGCSHRTAETPNRTDNPQRLSWHQLRRGCTQLAVEKLLQIFGKRRNDIEQFTSERVR